MKDNIKTAWAYFTKNASDQFIDSLSREQLLIITKAMQEYANQFIDLAAEEACVTVDTSEIPYTSSWSMISEAVINEKISVNKQSILKIKELIK